jgi:hypothetical protein
VAFHEDALRPLGDGAAAEGAFEIVVLACASVNVTTECVFNGGLVLT